MTVQKAWRVAWRNLARNRRRNLATGMAVTLGSAGMVLLGAYATRVESFLRTNSIYLQHHGHVVVYHDEGLEKAAARPSRYSLTAAQQERVLAIAATDRRVEFAGRYLRGMGLAGNGCRTVPFVAVGVEPGVERRVLSHPVVLAVSRDFAETVTGRHLWEATDVEGAVGLSGGLARLIGKTRVHDEFGSRAAGVTVPDCASPDAAAQIASDANIQLAGRSFDGSLSAVDGEVVNVFHAPTSDAEDRTLMTSLDTLQRLYGTDMVTYIALYLRDSRDAGRVARDLQQQLRREAVPATVYPFTDERVNPNYVGAMAFLGALVSFIAVLVTSVVGLGLLNAVTLTVFERTRELGTFRALGYTRRQVVGLYVREVLLLALLGVAAGTVLALSIAATVTAANIRFSPPGVPGTVRVVLQPGLLVCGTVVAILLPLSVVVTWAVVRRRIRERTADLLTATTA